MKLYAIDFNYLAFCIEGFLYGLYSGIFILYLQRYASNKGTGNAKPILYFAICVLYVFSLAVLGLDVALFIVSQNLDTIVMEYRLLIIQPSVFGCCDFIAQSILIYRCWIVWGWNIYPVIIPSFLALAYLATWIATIIPTFISQGFISTPAWGTTLNITSLAISMAVNALVTSLIVFRIFRVFQEVKGPSDKEILGDTGEKRLQTIIFLIIESGMVLFSVQFARLVVTILPTQAALYAVAPISGIHKMLNGITPTIILVRVSMGLSFHDKTSLVEAASSLQFAADDPNLNSEMRSIGSQERKDDDIGVRYPDLDR